MIIHSMSANFGVLKNAVLILEPGLNVIESPNESGKSTWCAFLRTMLYGPDAGREGKRLEKQYSPWDGSPMSGEIELIWRDREITLRRFASPAGPLRGTSAVYTNTNMPVSQLGEADTGESLTGLSRNVFERTAFIGEGGPSVVPSAELEKKIAALITAGEEGTTFSEASETLRALQRRCRYRGKGLLPGLEQEMEALSAGMKQVDDITRELEALEQREEALRGGLAEENDTPPVMTAQQEALDLNLELLSREQQFSRLTGELRRSPFRGREPGDELRKTVRADYRRARKLEGENKKQPRTNWMALLVLGGLLALGGVVFHALLIPAAAALILGGAVWVFAGREDPRAKRELSTLLRRYSVDSAGEIPRKYEEYAAQWQESRALRAAAEELRTQSREAGERLRTLKRSDSGPRLRDENDQGITQELLRITERKGLLRGKLEAMEDPGTMESRYNNLRSEHERLERQYEALALALREMEAADEEMQTRFAPALSRAAEGIFRRLTGDRYSRLTFDKDLSAAASVRGDFLPREDRYMSRGTRDQLYLSLRLALCEMMAGPDPCPIVLDDALLTFDDERLGLAMEYLRELSEHRQIILFTCQGREKRWVETA